VAQAPRPGRARSRHEKAWQDALAALRAFAAGHGHTYPDRTARTADGRSLATWTSNARYAYHRGTLAADRVAALESVPGWVWRSKQPRRRLTTGLRHWDTGYPRLAGWVAERGRIPAVSAVTGDGYELGRFVRNCRQHAGRLDAEQRAALAALPGWSWHVTADRRAGSADRLDRARRFVAAHRYLPQLDGADDGERELARWLRRYQPGLAAEFAEIRRGAVADTWLRRYRRAAAGASDKSTVEWMSRQRAALRRGELPEPHRELFGRLRGNQERRWQRRAAELRSALRQHLRPSDAALGWLARQRQRDAAGRLTAAQSAELATLVALLADARAHRPAVRCQAPGCDRSIQRPSRGRPPRYCGPRCRAVARNATAGTPATAATSPAPTPAAQSAAALIRLVPALQRIAAGHRAGLPALACRVQRAAHRFTAATSPAPRRRRLRRRWRTVPRTTPAAPRSGP
jgi:helicase associated protein